MKAISSLLWLAFALTSANARATERNIADAMIEKFSYLLNTRQEGADGHDDSCALSVAACSPCAVGGCGAGGNKLKQRHHVYNNGFSDGDVYDTNFTASEPVPASKHELVKRLFAEVDQSNVGTHMETQNGAATAVSLDGFYSNGSATSFSRQYEFANYITTNPKSILNPATPVGIIMGTGDTLLTGCVVLTIVSRRAVYMAHFWQPYGFWVVPAIANNGWMDGPNGANLDENVLNLIGGKTPLYYASGVALDVTLFNQANDLPYAYLMAPRYPGNNAAAGSPDQIYLYWPQIQAIGAYIQELLPNLQAYLPIPYIAQAQYPANELYRGQALFEYDPNADGNGNGNWRLFYEETSVDGRSKGQNVVGVNQPT
ncbi:uncharacterized protein LY89DRAFT_737025 [Mollisia scopiformis]|uniref:Uncharacterized protein n=1 Tax=Mollisia scopiformis TaxID=149040 RepID=A0A194X1F0_MOLSC|nr:uncharacterized protein LY89DRAFT_737025 [Mollisia scopiformis]KUJ14025.1 hypothetical protein LY89DRAFT_737025 [Mollisia scopiformis]